MPHKHSNATVALLVVLVILLSAFTLWNSKHQEMQIRQLEQNMNNGSTQVAPQTPVTTLPAQATTPPPSTDVPNPASPGQYTYTSYALGIQFSYLKNGSNLPSISPKETGNTISFAPSFQDEYMQVFNRNSGETVDQALHRQIPQDFTNANCGVIADGTGSYVISDTRIPLSFLDSHLMLDGTQYQNDENDLCSPSHPFPMKFMTDPAFPNVIYYVMHEVQAPPPFADASQTTYWYQTIKLINN